MDNSKQFMMLFRFEPNFDYKPSEQELSEQHKQWGSFIGNLAIQEKLVSTHQLGFTGTQIKSDLSLSEGIHISAKETLGGNLIVKASTMEEACEMAKNCPILKVGGTVEVRDILPM